MIDTFNFEGILYTEHATHLRKYWGSRQYTAETCFTNALDLKSQFALRKKPNQRILLD